MASRIGASFKLRNDANVRHEIPLPEDFLLRFIAEVYNESKNLFVVPGRVLRTTEDRVELASNLVNFVTFFVWLH